LDNWIHIDTKEQADSNILLECNLLILHLLSLIDEKPGNLFTAQCIAEYTKGQGHKFNPKDIKRIMKKIGFHKILDKKRQYYKITRNDLKIKINNM
jgi:hypothetical protein